MPTTKSELLTIADKFDKRMRLALIQAIEGLKDELTLEALLKALESGGMGGAMALVDQLDGELRTKLLPEFQTAYLEGGRMGAQLIPAGAVLATPQFNMLDARTIPELTNHNIQFVQNITNTTRQALLQNLRANIIAGNSPLQTARDFREAIGLTPQQELAVRNYRKALLQGDASALTRALRDKRSDKLIARLAAEGKPLPEKQVNSLVERYRANWIKYRAESIGRTEALRAVHMAQDASMNQSIESGAVDEKKLRKFWDYTKDEKTRASHRQIPGMNPGGVGPREAFKSPLGMIRYPLDPRAGAQNTIRCRCSYHYELVL